MTIVSNLVYDVGLHRGEDTAFYLARGYRVVAFEAHTGLVEDAHRRFAAEIAAGRLTIVPGAITESPDDTVTFFVHPNSVWGTTSPAWAERNLELANSVTTTVRAIHFEDELARHGVPHFMKIDIEGADMACLRALTTIGQRPTFLSLESEQGDFALLQREFDTLEDLGFTLFAVVQQAKLSGTRIRTVRHDGTPLDYEFEPDSSGSFGDDVGPWISRSEAEEVYRGIFTKYHRYGPDSWFRNTRVGRVLRGRFQQFTGHPLPGWFDTHAR